MKYNSKNKPLICMQTQSTCYKGTKQMEIKGILWHSTGANNTTLKRYIQPSDVMPEEDTYNKEKWLEVLGKNKYNNDWNHIVIKAGLNAWIGTLADGTVTTIQTMPWDLKPWGCGSGIKGSCNDGWIQFEICEDGLTDKTYFNKVYTEACELTAYLCKMFNINPKGTVKYNGVKVPTILCHQDSYKLKLGSNHSDVLHWFKKYGKTMAKVRNDVAKMINKAEKTTEKYYVRKAWLKPNTQKGVFNTLEEAITCCQKAGKGYKVYGKKGKILYTYVAPISTKIDVIYQVWDDKKNKWLPNVKNDTDYAGIFGNPICAVYANLSSGNITYQVHARNIGWFSEVHNREDYAGLFNKPIDAIRMKTDTNKKIEYRVHLKTKKTWLPWVTGYDKKDSDNGYAGIFGYEIDALQVRLK